MDPQAEQDGQLDGHQWTLNPHDVPDGEQQYSVDGAQYDVAAGAGQEVQEKCALLSLLSSSLGRPRVQ